MSPKHHEQALLLLRFLQQRQRKAELEQTLVLAEAQGSPLVILPRQHIFSWKKKPKVDAQAVRRELSEIEKHPISLSSQACLELSLIHILYFLFLLRGLSGNVIRSCPDCKSGVRYFLVKKVRLR